nr:MAG TPA: hypothetical protein [Caudoviricetes sp.]
MKLKLKIQLKIMDNGIIGRILEQDEGIRAKAETGAITLIRTPNFLIRSSLCPAVSKNTLFIRGIQPDRDDRDFTCSFSDKKEINTFCYNIIEAVALLNDSITEVVDEEGNIIYINQDGNIAISHKPFKVHEPTKVNKPIGTDKVAKADKGKIQPTLVSPDLVKAVAEVRMFGTEKYHDPDNWKEVEPPRYLDALYRHLLAYIGGEECDLESGLSHLAHMGCNISFLLDKDYKEKWKF